MPRRDCFIGVVVVAVYAVCLVNAAIAVDWTRSSVDGPEPEALEQRYGPLRPYLSGVPSAAYVTDVGARFVNARYVLAPTVLDPSYVELRLADSAIVSLDLGAMVTAAEQHPPMRVLCDFGGASELAAFLDRLVAETAGTAVAPRTLERNGGLALVLIGD